MTGADILVRAILQLNDVGFDRWSEQELSLYISEGQRVAAEKVPASTAKTAAVLLARGETRHDLPDEAAILIDITRNLGANGATPGRSITRMGRAHLDQFYPGWHAVDGAAVIKHYDYDPKSPFQFIVFPPAASDQDVYVEAVYSVSPEDISDMNAPLAVSNRFADALADYAVSRALSKDAEYAGEDGRAAVCMRRFYEKLGVAK